MSGDEVAWRARSAVGDLFERVRLTIRWSRFRAAPGISISPPRFRVTDVPVRAATDEASGEERRWRDALIAQADAICAHRFSFLNLHDVDVGPELDWNRDYESGIRCPLGFAQTIDYRDHRSVGDAKLVWEMNRHHHLVVLGRAYRVTGDRRFAEELVSQLDSWLTQCPVGRGMNWRSPLELAIRLINWVWAIDLVLESGAIAPAFERRLIESIAQHTWAITRKYSRWSSANNHRIGEAAGVFIASSYFTALPDGIARRDEAKAILIDEICRQTHADGGGREQAFGYELFVLQFSALAGLVSRSCGDEMPAAYWDRVERMLEFVAALGQGGPPPYFGDCDDGYVLDLGEHDSAHWLLGLGGVLFGRSDFKAASGGYSEPLRWLLGPSGRPDFDAVPDPPNRAPLVSRCFRDSGYYLLQRGQAGEPESISIVFDCGDMGLAPLHAHGHADALSFVLRVGNAETLIDTGTFDYFSAPIWRDYFRGTCAHNTITVDGQEQGRMDGPFLWTRPPRAWCVRWQAADNGGLVTGEHDGYWRLPDPVRHLRTLHLIDRLLMIRDELIAAGRHEVALHFHVADGCDVRPLGAHEFAIVLARTTVELSIDPRLTVRVLRGSEEPIAGWRSRRYHERVPCTTLVCAATFEGQAYFECRATVASRPLDATLRGESRSRALLPLFGCPGRPS
jgi:hypothetical protein